MSQKKAIHPPHSPPVAGPYHPAVRFGNLLFGSGQIPMDPATGALQEGDMRRQTQRVLDHIHAILAHENLEPSHVVKTTIYLVDLKDFTVVNEVYASFFQGSFPARSTVQVAGLPKGARIEIEFIAHYPEEQTTPSHPDPAS
jgi:2-iminobutanoate/2-iminopropanoate deaminase